MSNIINQTSDGGTSEQYNSSNNNNYMHQQQYQQYQKQHQQYPNVKKDETIDQYLNFGTPQTLQSPVTLQSSVPMNSNDYSSPSVPAYPIFQNIQDIQTPPSTTTAKYQAYLPQSNLQSQSHQQQGVQAGVFNYASVPGSSSDTPPPAPTTSAHPLNFFSDELEEKVYPSATNAGFRQALSQRNKAPVADMFLDEFTSLNSPTDVALNNHYGFVLTPPQQQQSVPNSANESNATPIISLNPPPPPMIISPPPGDEAINNNNNISNNNASYLDDLDFSGPSFHHLQVSPSLNNNDLLSEYSSASASPYLPAQSPGNFEEDFNFNSQNFDLLSPNGVDVMVGGNIPDRDNQLDLDLLTTEFSKLTKENLTTNHNNDIRSQEITISIQAPEDPEHIAQKTPSLFSNSNRSSPNNSPFHSRANSTNSQGMKAGHYANLLSPNDAGSNNANSPFLSDDSPTTDFLKLPDDSEHQDMRRGRQRRQSSTRSSLSRSRSKSDQRSSDERSLSANREKMLELASPNQSNKRTQKHPSLYSCHLCEKRFTRPYNLKSHLRTHTDERPFVCTVCGKAFARQHDRKRHEDLHSGNKKFECYGVLRDGTTEWGCRKRFARTDALGRHFKTEAGKICIKPLLEEHEKEIKEKGLLTENYGLKDGLPESLFEQFPDLFGQNSGAASDLEAE